MKQDRDMIESYLSRAEDALKAALVEIRDASQAHKLKACLDLIESVSAKMWRGDQPNFLKEGNNNA